MVKIGIQKNLLELDFITDSLRKYKLLWSENSPSKINFQFKVPRQEHEFESSIIHKLENTVTSLGYELCIKFMSPADFTWNMIFNSSKPIMVSDLINLIKVIIKRN